MLAQAWTARHELAGVRACDASRALRMAQRAQFPLAVSASRRSASRGERSSCATLHANEMDLELEGGWKVARCNRKRGLQRQFWLDKSVNLSYQSAHISGWVDHSGQNSQTPSTAQGFFDCQEESQSSPARWRYLLRCAEGSMPRHTVCKRIDYGPLEG